MLTQIMRRRLLSILLFCGLIGAPAFGQSSSEPEIEIEQKD